MKISAGNAIRKSMSREITWSTQPAEEAGQHAEHHAEHGRQHGGRDGDQHRDPRAVGDAGEDVAAVPRFDAEPVLGADPAERAERQPAEVGVDGGAVEVVRRRGR